MKIRYLFTALAVTFVCGLSKAQPVIPDPSYVREWLMESVASAGGDFNDYEAILMELEYMREHPLDLNISQRSDLQKLPFLTEFQVSSLLEYREKNGRFLSIYELQVVYGFTDEVIGMILPFVAVPDGGSGESKRSDQRTRGNHEMVFRTQRVIEKARGYRDYDSLAGSMHYPGSPWLYNLRYGFEWKKKLQAGFTLEKDPGESLFTASNRAGFDFYSAHIMVHDVGAVKSIIAGDYRLAFGQGLTLWNGASPGKSSMPLNIVKRQDAAKAFSSNDENNFFRGIAASLVWKRFTLTGYCSIKKRDANITDTLESDIVYFSSFQESGYHRTLSEITDEKSLREMVIGANLLFRSNNIKVGTTLVSYHFDKTAEAGRDLKDVHDFTGNQLLNWGLDYSVVLKKIQCFGETSYGNQYWATLNGMLLNINKYASFSMLYRNYGAGYYSVHSSAFSESAADSNEEGFYAGMVIHPVPKWTLSAYADIYRFGWLKSGLSAPASGSDFLFQVDYKLSKQIGMFLRIKFESDPEDVTYDSQIIPDVTESRYTGFRYHISYRLTRRWLMQNRVELVTVNPASSEISRGIMLYHDVEYRFTGIPVEVDFRLAWFNTGSYASRIYAYEQDMTSGFSFSPLHDNGCRAYLMIRYDISKYLSCRLRWSRTAYFDRQQISAGFDEIDSSSRNDLKLQLSLRF